MGSTGSGRFSDYPGTRSTTSGGGGATGGTSGVDRCQQAFHTALEEVGNCELYATSHTVPATGEQLKLVFSGSRIFAMSSNDVQVGALPTSFNYLAACMASGIEYFGIVTSSTTSPFPIVAADFAPNQP